MFELTPELQAKFDKFRDSYEWALIWLTDDGGNAETKEQNAVSSALRDVPLSEDEREMFLQILKDEVSVSSPAIGPKPLKPIPKPE